MVKLEQQLVDEIEQAVQNGLVSKRKHSECPYYILNYTPAAQYGWKWTRATINCRGLIVDENWNVVARPFKKFFTIEQWKELRNSVHHLYGVKYKNMFDGPYNVQPKVDGSLGILYCCPDGKYQIATRGSFESEQAIRATDILDRVYNFNQWVNQCENPVLNNDYTYLFEIIYPENRIVVNYGDCEQLILLAVIDNETGKEIIIDSGGPNQTNIFNLFPIVERFMFNDWRNLRELNVPDEEGYVVHFLDKDIRVKIKFDNYLRLHKLVAQMTPKNILEQIIALGVNHVKENIKDLPDELYNEAETILYRFLAHYQDFRQRANILYDVAKNMLRKEFAINFKEHDCQRIVFSMLDNKPEWALEQQTWLMVEKLFKDGKIVIQ